MMSGADVRSQEQAATHPVIAVVDDDALFLQSVGRVLRLSGYRAALFSSGQEFLTALPSVSPKCVVLDVHMPAMGGLELQDRLRAEGSHVPIIFVTAYDTAQTRERAGQPDSYGVLLKPFRLEELLSAIRAALASQAERSGGRD